MSSPLSGSASGSPAPGFYPDPSIPSYIRYWNGSAWVPGTSRPEPRAGEPMPEPPSAAAASSAISEGPPPSRAEPAPAEETGPVFLDEELGGDGQVPAARGGEFLPQLRPRGEVATTDAPLDWDDPYRLHGQRPEPASAWQADASRQTGFAGQTEDRISWGRGDGTRGEDGTADPRGGWGRPGDEGRADGAPAAPEPAQSPPPHEGTFQMRAMSPQGLRNAAQEARTATGNAQLPQDTVGLRRPDLPKPGGGSSSGRQAPAPTPPVVPGQSSPAQQQQAPPQQQSSPQQQAPAPAPPALRGSAQAPPGAPQQGAGRGAEGTPPSPSWAQQVHDLAGAPGGAPAMGGLAAQHSGGPDAVTPWRPPTSDPFLQAAQEARPGGLGKRLAARIVDGVLTSAVAVGVTFPFVGQAVDHIEQKMDAVRQAGATEQVWLIDGTTGGYLALVLGALVVFGLLYEVLPTARWGRTLGKKMFGLKVLTMGQQERPGFGGALLRWLVHGVLSVLVIGVVNVLWCVFDRPWRQCWHDKLAGTFVSKDSGEARL